MGGCVIDYVQTLRHYMWCNWAFMYFGVHGGPGMNLLWILRDNCNMFCAVVWCNILQKSIRLSWSVVLFTQSRTIFLCLLSRFHYVCLSVVWLWYTCVWSSIPSTSPEPPKKEVAVECWSGSSGRLEHRWQAWPKEAWSPPCRPGDLEALWAKVHQPVILWQPGLGTARYKSCSTKRCCPESVSIDHSVTLTSCFSTCCEKMEVGRPERKLGLKSWPVVLVLFQTLIRISLDQ